MLTLSHDTSHFVHLLKSTHAADGAAADPRTSTLLSVKTVATIFWVGLFFLGLAAHANAAAFTSTVNGNWNDGATWGHTSPGTVGVDFPGASDTATIGAQKTVTIPVGYSASVAGITYGTGVIGTHTKLIINGTLTLGGNVVMHSGAATYADLTMGAGSTLNMGAYNVLVPDYCWSYSYIHFLGTSGSRATVTSSGGSFTKTPVCYAYADVDLEYTDFTGLGTSFSSYGLHTGLSFVVSHSTFTSCGSIYMGTTDSHGDNSYVEYSIFINPTVNPALYFENNGTPVGRNEIIHSTFSSTAANSINVFAHNLAFNSNVLKNVVVVLATGKAGDDIENNIFYTTGLASGAVTGADLAGGGAATFSNNYLYTEDDNPHFIFPGGAAATITHNVIETNTQGTITDQSDVVMIPNANSASTIANNINIGTRNFSVLESALGGSSSAGTIFNNNTNYSAVTSPVCFSVGETYGGKANMITSIQNNLNVKGSGAAGGYIVRDITPAGPADKVTTGDYNGYYNLGATLYQPLKSSGSYGAHDVNVNPNFVDPAHNFISWDTSLGGAGTSANAIAEMLKLNGTGGTFNSNYSIANLLAYVRAGFHPTAPQLRAAGYDGSDIGALSNNNTAPSLSYQGINAWNKGDVIIPYSLTDTDSDTINLTVQYSTDNTNWNTATKGTGGSDMTGLASSPSGMSYSFVWSTGTDLSTTESSTVYIKITPSDGGGGLTAYTTSAFGVDNVAPSSVGDPAFGSITTSTIVVNKPSTVTENGSGLYQWQARRNSTTALGFSAVAITSITDSSLSANTQYTYDVEFTDAAGNISSYGAIAQKYTAANTPNAPIVNGDAATTLNVNPISGGSESTMAIYVQQGATCDGSGGLGYVQANGSISGSAAWQTDAAWSTVTVTGLTPGTQYSFCAKSRNGDNDETTFGSLASGTTLSDDDTVTSSTYTVSSLSGNAGTITNVPYGTSKATFEAALAKGEPNQTWTDTGIHATVLTGDTLVVTAQDGVTQATYTITVNASSDATLSSLTISSGTLSPTFSSGTTSYTDSVANSVTSVTVTPTVNQANATITVNGTTVSSGSPSGSINLNVGSNTITVVVTAQDGTTTDTYTIAVTRAGSSAKTITAFNFNALSPAVTGTITEGSHTIALTVPYGTAVTALVPTITNTGSSVSPASGVAHDFTSPAIYTVTAADASTEQYTVTVTVAQNPLAQQGGGGAGRYALADNDNDDDTYTDDSDEEEDDSEGTNDSEDDDANEDSSDGASDQEFIAQLQAQIQDLITKINALKLQGQTVSSSASTLTEPLFYGSKGSQVVLLQNILQQQGFFPKEVNCNGRFGPTTLKAVQAFQVQNNIATAGTVGYGRVGPSTRTALNELAK